MVRPEPVQLVHHRQHVGTGAGVEVTGGLVGQQQVGLGHQRPGHRHPLLLAPRQLGGQVVDPVGQAHLLQGGHSPLLAVATVHPGVDEGQLHVAPGRQPGQEVELLEHEPDAAVAHVGQLLLVHLGHVGAGQ